MSDWLRGKCYENNDIDGQIRRLGSWPVKFITILSSSILAASLTPWVQKNENDRQNIRHDAEKILRMESSPFDPWHLTHVLFILSQDEKYTNTFATISILDNPIVRIYSERLIQRFWWSLTSPIQLMRLKRFQLKLFFLSLVRFVVC